ncbi:MAG: hypothetical protein PF549_02515 [Patescibacteria group bacterium]|jgi:hypothetical protein|nr:hypothetical protein [Patescibacteria group bacterium]
MKGELEFLFGSRVRWRLIKFFILNGSQQFFSKDVANINKLNTRETNQILQQLVKAKFLISRSSKKVNSYYLNKKFSFYNEIKDLVVKSNIYPQCESLKKVKHLGDVRLAIVSGIFINHTKAKTDLIIVADNVSRAKMKHLLEELTAEMGREIDYSLMTFEEFKYRVDMFDKFIMEIIGQPHEIVINKVAGLLKEIRNAKK